LGSGIIIKNQSSGVSQFESLVCILIITDYGLTSVASNPATGHVIFVLRGGLAASAAGRRSAASPTVAAAVASGRVATASAACTAAAFTLEVYRHRRWVQPLVPSLITV
jgi:hypothetical protein